MFGKSDYTPTVSKQQLHKTTFRIL